MSAGRPKRAAALKREATVFEYDVPKKRTKEEIEYEKKHEDRAARKGRGLMRANTVFEYAGHPETRETAANPYGRLIGKRVEVWWPKEKFWYAGRVTEHDTFNGIWTVKYDDGATVLHHLDKMKYKLEGESKPAERHLRLQDGEQADQADDEAALASAQAAAADADGAPPAKKAKKEPAKTPAEADHVAVPMHVDPTPPVVTSFIASTEGSKAVVDPLSGLADVGHVYTKDGVVYEATMALVDISQNMDKFYVVQVVEADDSPKFWSVQHWGRTGTKGQCHVDGPMDDVNDAIKLMKEKFHDKTGVDFDDRDTAAPVAGKYQFKKKQYTDAADKKIMWQYYVDDYVDGKAVGWYNYTAEAAATVEGVHSEWRFNNWLDVRSVQSGYWEYHVDFNKMTQKNLKTSKERKIRRIEV